MEDSIIKIVSVIIGSVSLITGIFMPFILNIIKRNARNTDDKLSKLYIGQENTLEAIQKLELKYNDTKNKTNSNYTAISETKTEIKAKFDNVKTIQKM